MELTLIAKKDNDFAMGMSSVLAWVKGDNWAYYVNARHLATTAMAHGASGRIKRLNVVDHGFTDQGGGFFLGSTIVHSTTVHKLAGPLSSVGVVMAPDGYMNLMHCWAGNQFGILSPMARMLGRPIFAYKDAGWAGGHWHNFGLRVRYNPDGSLEQWASLP